MSRRSPRSPAEPRPDDHEARPTIVEPATDDGDDVDQPVADRDRPSAADDTALLGAYALGALTLEERAVVEERLAASPALQDELRRLIPVAALLREATDAPPRSAAPTAVEPEAIGDPPPHEDIATARILSSSDANGGLSPRIGVAPGVTAPGRLIGHESPASEPDRRADPIPADDESPAVNRVEAAPGSLSSQPAGRRPRAAQVAPRARPSPMRIPAGIGSWPLSWVAASLATLVAVGAVLWALALVDRLDTRQREVDALQSELSELRARGDAAVVALAPVEGGPAEADGVAVVVPSEGAMIVRVTGIPPSADGRVYQVWFQDAAEGSGEQLVVGPVFRVGESGTALVELRAAAPDFTRLAISDEPSPGVDVPTGAFLLEGTVAAAEGE